jgi:hypothetical protein
MNALSEKDLAYYRLRTVDRDGATQQSATRIVTRNRTRAAAQITAFPNPVTQSVTLRIGSHPAGEVSVTVYDLFGREVKTSVETLVQGSTDITLTDLGSLETGVYSVRISSGGHEYTSRFVKK